MPANDTSNNDKKSDNSKDESSLNDTRAKFQANMQMISSLYSRMGKVYATQPSSGMPSFSDVVANAEKQVQENYKKISTLSEVVANAQKQVAENCEKIGTLEEAATNAEEQVKENCDKIGTFQEIVENAQKQVAENLKNIGKLMSESASLQISAIKNCKDGYNSTIFANAFANANQKVPDNYKEAGAFFDDLTIAGMENMANTGQAFESYGMDVSNPTSMENSENNEQAYEGKINGIMDQYKDKIDEINAFIDEFEKLSGDHLDSNSSDIDSVNNEYKGELDQTITDYQSQLDTVKSQAEKDENPVDLPKFSDSYDTIEKEYQNKIDGIMDNYKDQLKKLPVDVSGIVSSLAGVKQDYYDKIAEILSKYKDDLDKLPGKPVANWEDLQKLSDLELLARVIYGEQSVYPDAQSAVAWTAINRIKSIDDLRTNVFKPGTYECLKDDGDNKNAYVPSVDSKAWQNAMDLAEKVMSGDTSKIPNPIGKATEFRSKNFFYSQTTQQTDAGNIVYYLGGNKLKNVQNIGGNIFFEYDK